MNASLRLLLVEDSEDDSYLLVHFLKQHGYNLHVERVDSAEAMRTALQTSIWDLIIADYHMPHFSGIEALQIAKASGLDLPFIILSGVIGEDAAVSAMQAGAHDYLSKGNLSRLIPAIERELHDASERRTLRLAERQLYRLSYALEQSPSQVMLINVNREVEYINSSFSHVTGYQADDLLARKIDEWQPAIFTSSRMTSHSSWRGEIELTTKTGENYWAQLVISPIVDGDSQFSGWLIIHEDTTARKQLEAQLQNYVNNLEQMVEERIAQLAEINQHLVQEVNQRKQVQIELQEAHKQAQAALRLKNEILSNMNHEIRTPISIIETQIYLLRKGKHGNLSDQQAEALTTITDQTQHLLNVIENLLTVANLEADNSVLELSRFLPSELITTVFAKAQPNSQAKGLELIVEIAPELVTGVWGDQTQLRRVLHNLLDNAIKFTDQGCISVRFFQDGPQVWSIQVTDSGPGIPVALQSHLFEPFWQADGTTTRKVSRGVGLGLTVTQKLVKLMGGEIQVLSDGQHGTSVIVTLPADHSSKARDSDQLSTLPT